MPYLIAADQGTTSSRAIIFDQDQKVVAVAQREITQYYPKEGWVEHDAMEIYSSQIGVISEVVAKSGIPVNEIAAIGITNQRETAVVWDRETGKPICNAVVWQCRRTAGICEDLKKRGHEDTIREKTGLVIDAYFAGTKYRWILDNVEGAREKAERGQLLCGTVDSWLIYKMTNGTVHVSDYTNASRTMLFNIHTLQWDEELCSLLHVPIHMLPAIVSSCEQVGTYNLGGTEIPIAGIAGDQQAALFGQTCFEIGEGKNTYGTGNFLLVNTGGEICKSKNGLITTVAASDRNQVQYALEGSVFVGGAVIQWLRDEMGLINEARDSEYIAGKVSDTAGVYVVPAFTGLGAPWWDMYARGTIVGITRGAGRNHIIRAALESIAYQSHFVISAMESDLGERMRELRVDGGASANNLLMQFQCDITDVPVVRPRILETTALGAAYLAGLASGVWSSREDIKTRRSVDRIFTPSMATGKRKELLDGFEKAVACSHSWADK